MLSPIALENFSSLGSASLLSFDFDNLMDHQPQLLDSVSNSCHPMNAKDPQTHLLEFSPTAVATHHHQHEESPEAQMIKIFPSTICFDPSLPSILSAPESSSSASTSSAQSCETPSCTESILCFNWPKDGISNLDVLAPTVPDLSFSFAQPSSWKQSPQDKSFPTVPAPQSHDNCNIKHFALDSTPTSQGLKPKVLCQFNHDDDDDEDDDKEDQGELNDDGSAENTGCFTRDAATTASMTGNMAYSSPLRKRIQSVQATASSEPWVDKMSMRAVTQMGMMNPAGSGEPTILATGNERLRPKKSLGFLLGTGRLRSATCLESQLEDVLSQAQHHRHASCLPSATNPLAYRFPASPSDPSIVSSTQKRKNRLSTFLSFLPSENSNSNNPSQSHSSPNKPSANLSHELRLSQASFLYTLDSSLPQPAPSFSSPSSTIQKNP
ncbi:uncharacterized protein VP01_822g4 [Puccinia sorghi]|uniref:Uncharacterized protein n=1 Tax=Puccinia sorghi TaxID=27349 RepID=A0A0L6UA16_9BASI|nr:uncharacterized protein VP01_822g4 [Puccinia sorghi]